MTLRRCCTETHMWRLGCSTAVFLQLLCDAVATTTWNSFVMPQWNLTETSKRCQFEAYLSRFKDTSLIRRTYRLLCDCIFGISMRCRGDVPLKLICDISKIRRWDVTYRSICTWNLWNLFVKSQQRFMPGGQRRKFLKNRPCKHNMRVALRVILSVYLPPS